MRARKKKEADVVAHEDPSRELFLKCETEMRGTSIYLTTVNVAAGDWKNKHMKILVVGAGISGITAARYLKDLVCLIRGFLIVKGYDVTVLEGRERIGGRIHTITWSNQYFSV